MMPDLADLDPLAMAAALERDGRRLLAGPVHVFARLASTMDSARALAQSGAPEGTVVVADEQVAGRGRLGRTWTAPPGTSLLFTVLFRPPRGTPLVQVPMAMALGVLAAVRAAIPVSTGDPPPASLALKWPNDLVARQARGLSKLGGLLAEIIPGGGVETDAGRAVPDAPAVLVGVGLNVSQRDTALPPGAASLAHLGALAVDRGALLAGILIAADHEYSLLLSGADLVPGWSGELETLGQAVTVTAPSGEVRGQAVAVAADGALLVRDDAGTVHTVRAGDIGMPGGSLRPTSSELRARIAAEGMSVHVVKDDTEVSVVDQADEVLLTNWGPVRLDQCHPILRDEIALLGDAEPFASHLGCARRLRGQLESVPDEALAWRPAAGEWSVLEVLAHLVHTEVVYGYRYRMIVGHPGGLIEGYDQDDWVNRLPDAGRDAGSLLAELEQLKGVNVGFLQRLSVEDRASWGMHSERGPESIQALIGAMAGHDILHERQIAANLAAYRLRVSV